MHDTLTTKSVFLRLATAILRIAFGILILFPKGSTAQDIDIKNVEIENEKVVFYYALNDTTRGRFYSVNIYSSYDNYISPLQHLKGDFGIEVRPGPDRKLEVNIKEEYGAAFEGKVAFEIRARVYVPFIRMEGFNASRKFKRGKTYEIQWTGGRPQNILNIDLFKGDHKFSSFTNIPNAGKYNIVIPKNAKPGRDYKFRVSDSKNIDEVVNTSHFSITRKIPLPLIILPVAGVGAVVTIIIINGQETECQDCLPPFPDTPAEGN